MSALTPRGLLIGAFFLLPSLVHAGERDRCDDTDVCVNLAILDVLSFVDGCSVVFPQAKGPLEAALAQWPVLKLNIPGLQETLSAGNPERAERTKEVLKYLKHIPTYEADIECSGRWEMMTSKDPRLVSDWARLPPSTLNRYRR